MELDWPPVRDASKVLECGLSYCGIGTMKLDDTQQYSWNHRNDPVKGFRSKTFPASLTGVFQAIFTKR
jgi:hypothetical protein